MTTGSQLRVVTSWVIFLMLSQILLNTTELVVIQSTEKCSLANIIEPTMKHFIYNDAVLELRMETSERITHQLTTAAFAIFVREVLGYPNITVTMRRETFNAATVLDRISECPFERCQLLESVDDTVPETMINLEVWVPYGLNMEQSAAYGSFEKCGILGPSGRFGWFMPEWTTQLKPIIDHWRSFQDPETAKIFHFNASEMAALIQHTKDPATNRFYCDTDPCKNGTYSPKHCDHDSKMCAVLIAEYPEYLNFIFEQISSLKLLVRVVWVGPNADALISRFMSDVDRRRSGRSVLFFAWKPSSITEKNELLSVAFPPCETLQSPKSYDMRCPYEIHRFEKIAWSAVKTQATHVFEALEKISFVREHLAALLKMYTEKKMNETIQHVACKWMNKNTNLWTSWLPTDWYTKKTELIIGGIFPSTGYFYSEPGMIPAADMAIDAVNKNETILKDYEMKLLALDGQCSGDMVLKAFIDYVRLPHFNRMVGILGPACSDTVEPIAGLSKHYKTFVVSYSAQGSSFSDRVKFPYFFRTIGEKRQFRYVFLRLMQELGWKRVAVLSEKGRKYEDYISALQAHAESNGITFLAVRKILSNTSFEYLKGLKKIGAKIIIGEFLEDRAREVMCEAYRQNMTAREGYVWFLPDLIENWYDVDNLVRNNASKSQNLIPCTTEQMIQAINGHFYLTYSHYAPDDNLMQEEISVRSWRNKYSIKCQTKNVSTSYYASYIYDSVWTYALALDKLLKSNHSLAADFHTDYTVENLRRILNETNFNGVSGRVRFTAGARLSDIQVNQWIINKTKNVVGVFPPYDGQLKQPAIDFTLLDKKLIRWLTIDGNQPVDVKESSPICVLESLAEWLNIDCQGAIVVANVLGFGIFAGFLIIFFFFFKRRYEKKVEQTEERMRALGLLSSGTLLTLDEWEIPRERIVINRKLGEGAFGTVYGGEAFFDDKGWVAVAVKTLKVGSTVEEKLDFLSEAEMMKRFNHKNIVSLLGVCTRNEPVYTVMEFILYGDLKTYLLARRHLVYEKSREDSDEISGRRLTAIALDVAKALSYLAEQKYVHRDVACRNCLVNSNRVAKLADFGMARPMYENDYYRFHRKGMLPVRWMAPESLMDGLFTPMTDIWSYGVLLYEIITFGSFPFQGLSNNQVLEHVKNGMTVDIPEGVKPQLETLLKSCWHRTPSLRPQAAEIAELLTNNTRLIQPCVGIPLSSIQIEGSNSLEIPLRQVRKSASSQGKAYSFASKLANFDLSLSGNSNNSETFSDPLLSGYPTTNYVTQYITLQHSGGEQIYVSHSREGISSQV